MAETIETIEIAKAIKAGLDTALAAACPVYASGVPTDVDGNLDDGAAENERKLPCVTITMRDTIPIGYRSVMREFAGRIQAATHFGSDPFQVSLYTLSRAVGAWLAGGPALSLTLRKSDAITVDQPPDVAVDDQVQYMQWEITVHTGPAA